MRRLTAIPEEPIITVSHTFPGPPAAVFDAFATSSLVQQWMNELPFEVCESDFTEGGEWHWVYRAEDRTFGFHGHYTHISRPWKIVRTYHVDGDDQPGGEEAITFTEVVAGTEVTIDMRFRDLADRDRNAESGLETRLSKAFSRLEALLHRAGTIQS